MQGVFHVFHSKKEVRLLRYAADFRLSFCDFCLYPLFSAGPVLVCFFDSGLDLGFGCVLKWVEMGDFVVI
jgi:hypothetical protein